MYTALKPRMNTVFKNSWLFCTLGNISWNDCTLWKGHKTECYWLWLHGNTHECISLHMSVFLRQNVSGKSVCISINCVLYHRASFSVQNHISHQDFYVTGLQLAIFFSMDFYFKLIDFERCIVIYDTWFSLQVQMTSWLVTCFLKV